MDLKEVCRTCLCPNGIMFPLFNENLEMLDSEFHTAVKILEIFTSAPIYNKDYLPDHICATCLNEIQRAYSFKLKCEKSEMILNQLKTVKINLKRLKDLSYRSETDSEIECKIQKNVKKETEEIEQNFELCDYDEIIIEGNESESKSKSKKWSNIQFAKVEYLPNVQVEFKNEPELEIEDIDCDGNEFKAEEQLKCLDCEKQFESIELFNRHIVTDHIKEKLCKLCNEEFDGSQFNHSLKHLPISFLDDINHENETKYCQHCSKYFADLKMLRLHACPSNASNRSDYNNEKLLEQETDQSHMEIKETEELIDSKSKHQCSVCSKVYGRKNSLSIHMRIHTGETPFQCKFCSEKFRHRYLLRVHIEIKHINELPDGKPKYQCNVCSKIFACKNHLVGHVLIHTGERPLQCKFCSQKYRRKHSLATHVKMIHPEELANDKPNYQCSICSKSFIYNSDLVSHMLIHIDEKPFQCEFCSKKFKFRHMVRVHLEKKHTNELPVGKSTYQCNICSKVFGYNCELIKHMRSHTDEKPFQCKLCSSNFQYRHLLRVHMDRKHIKELPENKPSEKPFQCKLCSKKFRHNQSLVAHMQSEHTNELRVTKTKHQCKVCSKVFGCNSRLVRHMLIHSGEKPFQCEVCLEKFRRNQSLAIHMETKHELPDAKPKNQCSICSKIFGYNNDLVNHMRSHTGESPFQCKVCSEKFRYSQSLVRHMKMRHSGELNGNKPYYQCSVCSRTYKYRLTLKIHMKTKHGMEFTD